MSTKLKFLEFRQSIIRSLTATLYCRIEFHLHLSSCFCFFQKPPPLIEVAKITEKPSLEPTTEIVEEDPDINHNKEITNNETKKEPVPAGQDSDEEQERQLEN